MSDLLSDLPSLTCPEDGVLLRDDREAFTCPECGYRVPYGDVVMPIEFDGPSIHGG